MDIGEWGPMPVFDHYLVQLARFVCFTASEDSRRYRQVRSTVLKLTCGLALPSLCPLDVTHMMNAPRPFVYYCPRKPKSKTRVGLGMRLSIYHLCSHSPRLYKGINFYLQTIFSQSWSPKGRRDIGNTLTLKDRAGLNWDFWSTVEGFQVSQW